jgi:aldehyde reductase
LSGCTVGSFSRRAQLHELELCFQEGEVLLPKDSSDNIIYSDVDYVDTWKAMEECVKQGLTKSIGISNFNSEQIQRILDIAAIKPVVNQVYTCIS